MTSLCVFRPVQMETIDMEKQIYFYGPSSTFSSHHVTQSTSSQTTSPNPERKKELSVKAKRDSTNRDACQQLFLIFLLLQNNYTVIIRKPRKKSTKTLQLFVIDRILSPEGATVYDINDFSSSSTDEKINRRNLDSHTNTTMINLLKEHNAYIEIKKGKKAEKTSQFDRVERVNFLNQNYTYSHIKTIGNDMNTIIRDQIKTNNFVLKRDACVPISM